jgi:hypothetical protein
MVKIKYENMESIDIKKFISIFNDDFVNITPKNKINSNTINNHTIWTVDNFLTDIECDTILYSISDHKFDKLEYRNNERLLFFDKNNKLINLIETRLDTSGVLDGINTLNHYNPSGFRSDCIEWEKNYGNINSCIRINKYINSDGFIFHRDSPFTNSYIVKSNYTIIIYLDNNYTHGETIFRIPDNEYEHNGYTIEEELDIIGKKYKECIIVPKKGMALIFDQRLIHMGNNVIGTKHVLRSDLICKGKFNEFYEISNMEKQIEILTKKLFRQAQLYELHDINFKLCNDLYERCISLRINPNKITNYPKHLEDLIIDINSNTYITNTLELISRNATKYEYIYKGDTLKMLKYATIFTIFMQTQNLTNKTAINNFNSIIKLLFGDDVNIISNVNNIEPNLDKGISYLNSFFDRKIHKLENAELTSREILAHNNTLFRCISTLNINNLDIVNKKNNDPINLVIDTEFIEYFKEYEKCSLCYNDNNNNKTKRYYYNPLFTLTCDDFNMRLIKLKENNGELCGKIEIKTYKNKSFNHASCSCDTYIIFGNNSNTKKIINFNINFSIFNNTIKIFCVPKVIM